MRALLGLICANETVRIGIVSREKIEAAVYGVLRSKAAGFDGEIRPDTPLDAGGLAIDSIGCLEVVLELERQTGLRLREESLTADALACPGNLIEHLLTLRENPDA